MKANADFKLGALRDVGFHRDRLVSDSLKVRQAPLTHFLVSRDDGHGSSGLGKPNRDALADSSVASRHYRDFAVQRKFVQDRHRSLTLLDRAQWGRKGGSHLLGSQSSRHHRYDFAHFRRPRTDDHGASSKSVNVNPIGDLKNLGHRMAD